MRASVVEHGNTQQVLLNAAGTSADTEVGTAALVEELLLGVLMVVLLGLLMGFCCKVC